MAQLLVQLLQLKLVLLVFFMIHLHDAQLLPQLIDLFLLLLDLPLAPLRGLVHLYHFIVLRVVQLILQNPIFLVELLHVLAQPLDLLREVVALVLLVA